MKKMPFPEVLNNVDHVLASVPELSKLPLPEPVPASDSDSLKEAGPVIEGFDRFNYEYDDWDGYDNVNDNTADVKGKDPRQILIDFINYLYNSTIAYNKMLAAYITNKVSNSKAIKEVSTSIKTDVNALKETVGLKSNTESDKEGNEKIKISSSKGVTGTGIIMIFLGIISLVTSCIVGVFKDETKKKAKKAFFLIFEIFWKILILIV
jgi:hypothetical protein